MRNEQNEQLTSSDVKILHGGAYVATKTLQEQLELAEDLTEVIELLGGEEQTMLFIKRALNAKETSRLAHKKYYLRRQIILAKAKEAGLDKEV